MIGRRPPLVYLALSGGSRGKDTLNAPLSLAHTCIHACRAYSVPVALCILTLHMRLSYVAASPNP